MSAISQKNCIKCNTEKNISCFTKKAQYLDGLNCYCKECVSLTSKAYYLTTKDVRREQQYKANKAFRENNKEKIKILSHSIVSRYSTYRSSAKKRHLSFDLTLEDFEIFWNSQCSYCGEDINGIGIDRIDSNRGYTLENCVPCCAPCNYMKQSHSEQEWYARMLLILKNQGVV